MKQIIYYELFKKDILKTIYNEKKLKRMDILTLFYLSEIDERYYVRSALFRNYEFIKNT